MDSIKHYIKSQLKQKVVSNPIITFLSFFSPVVFFLICFIVGKITGITKNNDQKTTTIQCIFMTTITYFIYIVLFFNAAYDLVNEKKKYRKQYMYTYGFNLINFHISWAIIYALLILPTSVIIVVIIYFAKIFPGINIVILFLAFYPSQVSTTILGFWFSSYFSNPIHSGLFSALLQIIFTISFLYSSLSTYANKNYNDSIYIHSKFSPFDEIIWKFKKAIDNNESIGLISLLFSKNISIFFSLSNIFNSTLLFIFFSICSDIFYIAKHIKRSKSDKKNQFFFEKVIKNNSNTNVKFTYEENIIENNGNENIVIENLFKRYSNSNELAINNVSFKVYSNEIVVIAGSPGSGKSTLMKMLYGRQSSSYGSITINGKEMSYWKWNSITQDISVAPKENYVFMEHLSVSDNINLYTNMCSSQENGISMLNEFNFNESPSDIINNLNEVEKTKVKITLALLKSKPFTFIEEPTSQMSESDSICFWNAIKSRKNNKSIIISTSSINEALIYGDRIIILKNGIIQCIGNREFVKHHLSINENDPKFEIKIN